ncbi:hypothetical protein V9T40_009361 [Parthenolecanium corni]|uniref:Uncharacterized protein n=1 Tax=Parthenolecanium corni TaxID=536013 RepID=A0AAN9TML1_9HEMI
MTNGTLTIFDVLDMGNFMKNICDKLKILISSQPPNTKVILGHELFHVVDKRGSGLKEYQYFFKELAKRFGNGNLNMETKIRVINEKVFVEVICFYGPVQQEQQQPQQQQCSYNPVPPVQQQEQQQPQQQQCSYNPVPPVQQQEQQQPQQQQYSYDPVPPMQQQEQ